MAGCCAFVLSWLLPNHYPPWSSFHSEALAFAAVLALAAAVLPQPSPRAPAPWIAAWPLALAALVWLQWAAGVLGFAGDAWVATLYLGALALAIHLGAVLAASPPDRLRAIPWVLLAAGLASVVLALLQWLRLEHLAGAFIANIGATGRPFANLAQPNLLAVLLLMALVSALWCFEDGRLGRAAFGLCLALLTFTLGLTQSRSGYVAAGVVAAYLAWQGRNQPQIRVRPVHLAAWLVVLAACAAATRTASVQLDLAGDRPVTLFDNNGRLLMWKQVFLGILEAPWAGYGWAHTPGAQMAGALHAPGTLTTSYAHNATLDFMAWFGIPVGILLTLLVAAWLVSRGWRPGGRAGMFAMALILPVAVHSQFEFSFAYTFFLLPVGILAGVLEHQQGRRTLSVPRWVPTLAIAALALLGAQAVREYLPVEDDFRYVRFESMKVGSTPVEHRPPAILLLTQLDAMLRVARLQPHVSLTPQELDLARRTVPRYPWAPIGFKYAQALDASGHRDEADRQMLVLKGMYGPAYHEEASKKLDELRSRTAPAR